MKTAAVLSFSDRGAETAQRVAAALGEEYEVTLHALLFQHRCYLRCRGDGLTDTLNCELFHRMLISNFTPLN